MNIEENSKEYKELDFSRIYSKSNSQLRRVSFPENETELVTGYLEPTDPLRLARNVDRDELLSAYLLSCEKHKTHPIDSIVKQIKEFNFDNERSDKLILRNVKMTSYGCETVEEIFKRVQFDQIDLSDCDLTNETAFILFELFEYYDSAISLNISSNTQLGVLGWQACSRYLRKTIALEKLQANNIHFSVNEIECLMRPLAVNRGLQVLKLENCNLCGYPMRPIVNTLSVNMTLKELYLADNNLELPEARLIGNLLMQNKSIQVLDLSNNFIKNSGLEEIVSSLCSNRHETLEVLIVWNNHLSDESARSILKLLKQYSKLTILNVGCNALQNSFVSEIKSALKTNKTLQRLGLQATKLNCLSAEYLADILKSNRTLERIDLRENYILNRGLRCLTKALDTNSSVIQIDLNSGLTSEINDESYFKLLEEINEKCQKNKLEAVCAKENEKSNLAKLHASRKISLTCQTFHREPVSKSPAMLSEPQKISGRLRSPDPSPACSPIPMTMSTMPKSRFSVSRVEEFPQNTQSSRFKVTIVEPPKSSPNCSPSLGYDCQEENIEKDQSSNTYNESRSTNCLNLCKSDESCFRIKKDHSDLSETSGILQESKSVGKSDNVKSMRGLERLLSLFQTPTTLFTDDIVERKNNSACRNESVESMEDIVNKCDCFYVNEHNVNSTVTPTNSSSLDSKLPQNDCENIEKCALNISEFESGATEETATDITQEDIKDDEYSIDISTSVTETSVFSDFTNNNKWSSNKQLGSDEQIALLLDETEITTNWTTEDG